MKRFSPLFCPLLSAVLLYFSFVPEWGFPLAHAALVPLLVQMVRTPAMWRIVVFGFSFGGLYFFWLKIFSVLAPVMLTVLHGFWIFLAFMPGYILLRRSPSRAGLGLVLTMVSWIAAEWLRSLGPYGYEWGAIGYSQYGSLKLSAYASAGGIWLVSGMVIGSNCALAWAWLKKDHRWLIAPAVLWIGLWYFSPFNNLSKDIRAAENFALVQANVSPYLNSVEREPILLDQAGFLSRESARSNAEYFILPETLFSTEITGIGGLMTEDARRILMDFLYPNPRRMILVGAIEKDEKGFYNSAILFDNSGRRVSSYRKRHLVPFGETIPGLEQYRWAQNLGEKLGTPFFSAGGGGGGPEQQVFGEIRAAVLICFEGSFSKLVAESAAGADLIINISNDAWSESEFGHDQHLRFLRFRAIETGLPVIRVGNSGPTALYAPNGQLVMIVPNGRPAILDLNKATPYLTTRD